MDTSVVSAPARVAETRVDVKDSLRLALRRVASTVFVVAAKQGDGSFFATTATAVTSVCFDPPTVLVCLNRSSAIGAAIEQAPVFSLSVLNAGQAPESHACAGGSSHDERKALFAPYAGEFDAAVLREAQAVLICRRSMALHCGTHTLVFGEVVDALHDAEVDPLIYLNGKYGSFAETKA